MTVQIGNNVQMEVQATLATAVTITGMTKADPAVATATAHGIADGTYGYLTITDGMRKAHTQVVRTANSDANTFELEGLDTTNYATWSAGTFTAVSTWSTLCVATAYSIANAAPTEIDETTLCDDLTRIRYGLPGQKSGSISIQHDSDSSALQYLEAADTSDIIAFRATYANGNIRVFGAFTAYGGGFSGGVSQLETGEIPITVPALVVTYTS